MPRNFANEGLQFVLCPGRFPDVKYLDVYNQVYNSWHDLWAATYVELKDKTPLCSDTFTRQDFIAAIFFNGICQSFTLFRHVDISVLASIHDSYFEQWSDLHIRNMSRNGGHVLICGNFGIMPGARGNSLGFSMKELMMGFVTEVALNSAADVVISTPRTDRKVNSAAYNWGGVCIAKDVDWGLDVIVDLTAFYKHEVLKKRNHTIIPLVEKLWEQKLVIPENNFESVNSFLHPAENIFKHKKVG